MLIRPAAQGVLIAVVFVIYQAVRGHLDTEAAVFAVVFGALYGTLDYFRNRKHGGSTHETDRARGGTDGRSAAGD